MYWEKVESIGARPGPRYRHTCTAVKNGRFLYLFGGYNHHFRLTNQLHVFDTQYRTWHQQVTDGIRPTARSGHSCNLLDHNLYLFGGSDGTNAMNDLYILNTSIHRWINPIQTGEVPLPREDHGAVFVDKRLFIFGGNGESPDTYVWYNDLYILDTETLVWTRPKTSGTPPRPRDSHTCSYWEKKIIVIGGGVAKPDTYLSDVHILHTDTLIWRELRTSGKRFPPRAGHSTVSFGKNLFVFGGLASAERLYNDLHMLDIDTGIWTEVATTNIGPSARISAAGDRLAFMGHVLVLFGGCNKDALDDMYYLYPGRQNIHPVKMACQIKVTGSISDGYTFETIIDGKLFHGIMLQGKPNPLNPATNTSSRRKRTFDETVSVFSNGYTIETIIDGTRLHGILFRDKLKPLNPATNTSSGRKRTFDEMRQLNAIPSNPITAGASEPAPLGLHLTKSPSVLASIQMRLSQQHDCRKVDHKGSDAAIDSKLKASNFPVTVLKICTWEASADPEPAAASLNRNDNEKNDKSKNDGANDNMTRSEVEVRTDDQTNVPISNNEAPRLERHDQQSDVQKPAAAEDGIAKDCTTRRVEDTENQQI